VKGLVRQQGVLYQSTWWRLFLAGMLKSFSIPLPPLPLVSARFAFDSFHRGRLSTNYYSFQLYYRKGGKLIALISCLKFEKFMWFVDWWWSLAVYGHSWSWTQYEFFLVRKFGALGPPSTNSSSMHISTILLSTNGRAEWIQGDKREHKHES